MIKFYNECITDVHGNKFWYLDEKRHREDGPAIEWHNGHIEYWVRGNYLIPDKTINDPVLKAKYPKLIASMIIYSVHNS